MISEDLEFSISQYVDGTLDGWELAELERVLATNAEARGLVAEYRRVNDAVQSAMPLPDIRWESFSQNISAAVDEADEALAAKVYRLPSWTKSFGPMLSLAASLLIATGVGVTMYFNHRPPGSISLRSSTPDKSVAKVIEPPVNAAPSEVAMTTPSDPGMVIIGPHAEASAEPVLVSVNVGPSDQVKDEPIVVRYSDDLISRPSRVAVASGIAPVHETDGFMQ